MTSKQATGMKLWVDQLSGAPLELGASSREVPSSEVRLIAVREGSCYLFARNEKNGEEVSAQTPILELSRGEILALPAMSNDVHLRMSISQDAEVLSIEPAEITTLTSQTEFVNALRNCAFRLNEKFYDNTNHDFKTISSEIGSELESPEGTSLITVPTQSTLAWILEKQTEKQDLHITTANSPAQIDGKQTLKVMDTADVIADKGINSVISFLADMLKDLATEKVSDQKTLFAHRVSKSSQSDVNMLKDVVQSVSQAIAFKSESHVELTNSGFNNACCRIAAEMGAPVSRKIRYNKNSPRSNVEQFARGSGLQHRQVLLETNWWKRDSGHLLGRIENSDESAALIRTPRGYIAHIYDADGKERIQKVNAEFAATLLSSGEMFYPPFPNRALKMRDLVSLAFRGSRRDLLITLIATLVISGLNLTTPLVIGSITGSVVPLADRNAMFFLGGALLLAAISTALVGVVSGLAFLRVETRSSFFVLAAFVDRTLKLPSTFFRKTSAGDLTQRVMAIEKIRSKLTQSVVSFVVSFLSGFSYIALMFTYDTTLALIGLGLVVGLLFGLLILGLFIARREYAQSVARGELDSSALDLISGIRQARIQGSMKRVLSRVTDRLGNLGRQTYITQLLTTALTTFTKIYPSLATVTIFAIYGYGLISDPATAISDADFLAFNASLAGFFATTTMIGATYVTLISIIPMYQRLKPIMQATPEIKEDAMDPGTLEGTVEVQDMVFRYAEDLPLILDGVNIKVNQNECVAVVGRTGCGKSTLIKLLLGLEKPESGSILFDGTPLENVDASLVRSQLGVVMQANHLTPGNVRSTILGLGTDKPIEIAWEAARLAKIDDEIEAMPMGMLTLVNPESISGGQAQRLLIARALVGNPRILILDEATSELDDVSQAEVTESIMSLGTTRLIIAHRLSTIKTADRIYVLESGKVVQEGSFEELSTQDGAFKTLVEEQML